MLKKAINKYKIIEMESYKSDMFAKIRTTTNNITDSLKYYNNDYRSTCL